eukprot:COSAG06_NODE_4839_length_3918_cov_1.490966_3_plen_254_part_00
MLLSRCHQGRLRLLHHPPAPAPCHPSRCLLPVPPLSSTLTQSTRRIQCTHTTLIIHTYTQHESFSSAVAHWLAQKHGSARTRSQTRRKKVDQRVACHQVYPIAPCCVRTSIRVSCPVRQSATSFTPLSKISWSPVRFKPTPHTTQQNQQHSPLPYPYPPRSPLLSLSWQTQPVSYRISTRDRQTDTIAVVVVRLCAHRSRSPAWPSGNICALSSAASFLFCPAHTHTHMTNSRTRTRPRAHAHTDASRQSRLS